MKKTVRVVVKGGQLLLDKPLPLPDGTELEIAVSDPGDELDEEERAALHLALQEAWESARKGHLIPATQLLKELRESASE